MKYAINTPKNHRARLSKDSQKLGIDTLFSTLISSNIIIASISKSRISLLSLINDYNKADIVEEIAWTQCDKIFVFTENQILYDKINNHLTPYKSTIKTIFISCESDCTGVSITFENGPENINGPITIYKNFEKPSLLLSHPYEPLSTSRQVGRPKSICLFNGQAWSHQDNNDSTSQNASDDDKEVGILCLLNAITLYKHHAYYAAKDHALNAIKRLTRCVTESNPNLATAYYYYGLALFSMGEIAEAQMALSTNVNLRLAHINPSKINSEEIKKAQKALKMCQETLLVLNRDLLGEVFQYLPIRDILSGMTACKTLYQAVPRSTHIHAIFYNQLSLEGQSLFSKLAAQQNTSSLTFFRTAPYLRAIRFRYSKQLHEFIALLIKSAKKKFHHEAYLFKQCLSLFIIKSFNNAQLLIEQKFIPLHKLDDIFHKLEKSPIFYDRFPRLLNLFFSLYQVNQALLTNETITKFLELLSATQSPIADYDEFDEGENDENSAFNKLLHERLQENVSLLSEKDAALLQKKILSIHKLACFGINTALIIKIANRLFNESMEVEKCSLFLKTITKIEYLSPHIILFSNDIAELLLSNLSLSLNELQFYTQRLYSILNITFTHLVGILSPNNQRSIIPVFKEDLIKRIFFLLKTMDIQKIEVFVKEISIKSERPDANRTEEQHEQFVTDMLTQLENEYLGTIYNSNNAASTLHFEHDYLKEADELYAYFTPEGLSNT